MHKDIQIMQARSTHSEVATSRLTVTTETDAVARAVRLPAARWYCLAAPACAHSNRLSQLATCIEKCNGKPRLACDNVRHSLGYWRTSKTPEELLSLTC